jgi:hypothetical protein
MIKYVITFLKPLSFSAQEEYLFFYTRGFNEMCLFLLHTINDAQQCINNHLFNIKIVTLIWEGAIQ